MGTNSSNERDSPRAVRTKELCVQEGGEGKMICKRVIEGSPVGRAMRMSLNECWAHKRLVNACLGE